VRFMTLQSNAVAIDVDPTVLTDPGSGLGSSE
jgi:hypothetical protein